MMRVDLGAVESIEPKTVTIKSAIMPGWWLAEDASGRTLRITGQELYRRGDTVTIVDNQIVAETGQLPTPTVYEV